MLLALTATSLDGGLYTSITELARRSPAALDSTIHAWSDYGLGLYAVLMLQGPSDRIQYRYAMRQLVYQALT